MATLSQGGIKFLEFSQEVPATTWEIYHGFGSKPLVDVNIIVNGTVQKAFPLSIIHIDDNNARVTWTVAQSGYASLASVMG